jgi:hypothetical protein
LQWLWQAALMTHQTHKLECLICGASFTVSDGNGADEIPHVQRFLSRHRRCLQRLIARGGTFARPL